MPTALALWLVMDDLRRQRDQLEKELRSASEALDKEYRSMASTWQQGLGPLTVKLTLNSDQISEIYILFNMVCFAVGIAFIFLKGTLQVIGISLVVGGLFSFSTFMAQWWDHAWQIQNYTFDRAFNLDYRDRRYTELQPLAKEYFKLCDKLESLPEPPSQDNGTGISKEEPGPPGPSA